MPRLAEGLDDRDVGPWFYAGFDSECADCGGQIFEGDRARFVDDEVVGECCG